MHARLKVSEYFSQVFGDATGITTTTNRAGQIEQPVGEHLEVNFAEETLEANDGETNHTLGVMARHAALLAIITLKTSDTSDMRLSQHAVAIEKSAALDHEIEGAGVDIDYAGMTFETDEELELGVRQMTLIFRCTYQTPVGDPESLV